jgi:hypothetical protein
VQDRTIRCRPRLFTALNNEVLVKKVASEIFLRLMPTTVITLKPAYMYPEGNFVPRR